MNLWKDLPTIDKDTNGAEISTIRVIIEISKGNSLKYELNSTGDYLTVVREMHPKYKYIYNYGMIPQTLGGDNDPLDAIIIYDKPLIEGSVINCKVLGVVKTIDQGEVDDKILCIPYFSKKKKVNIDKIIKYLNNYKYPNQKGTEVIGLLDSNKALELIHKAIKDFKEKIKDEV